MSGIVNFLHKIVAAAGHSLQHLFGSEVAHNLAQAALPVLNSALGKIAVTAVEQLDNNSLLSGPEKRAAAFDAIATTAKTQGIEAGTTIINFLIELAVQLVRGSLGSVEAATNTP